MIQGTDVTGGNKEPLMKRARGLRLLTILSTVILRYFSMCFCGVLMCTSQEKSFGTSKWDYEEDYVEMPARKVVIYKAKQQLYNDGIIFDLFTTIDRSQMFSMENVGG